MPYRLSTQQIREAALQIDPVFLHSPQFYCEPLGDRLGCALLLKVETINPIRSFKGRGADWLVSKMVKGSTLMCASAGNFGQAMAYSCRKYGISLTVYASLHANTLKLERMRALGATVVQFGEDFDAAKMEARRIATQQNARFVEDSLDIETLEGAGTIGLELLSLPVLPDIILVPLGNGALINGIARIIKETHPATQIIAVQSTGAPAMVESWKAGRIITHDSAQTIADGIAVRLPVPQALEDMQGLVDDAILTEDATIIKAMQLIHTHAGLVTEPSGAVGVAAIMENPSRFAHKKVATILCGSNLTPQQMREWIGT
jgi:threonine dehydratase